jgi:hypothetical protein
MKYHKILTVWDRDPDNNNKTLIRGSWACPEFEYLARNPWTWTEKIHGTNVRVSWDLVSVDFGGKTDHSQLPAVLVNRLSHMFPAKKFCNFTGGITLYGEGYGKSIQKGGHRYIGSGVDFILFDVNIAGWWLRRKDVVDVAKQLGIQVVPVLDIGILQDAIDYVADGFTSLVAEDSEYLAEGLVLRPTVELVNRAGERIITKVKHKDFL